MSESSPAKLQPASAARSDSSQSTKAVKRFRWAATGGIVGAFGIASCCLLPLVLVSLGLGGAWVGSLTVLTPFKPLFIVLTAALLGYGHYLL